MGSLKWKKFSIVKRYPLGDLPQKRMPTIVESWLKNLEMHGEYPKIRPRKCLKIMIPHQGSTSLEACRNWWPFQKKQEIKAWPLKPLTQERIWCFCWSFSCLFFFWGGSLTALPPVYNLHKERCQHLQTWEVANWSRIAWRPVKLKRLAVSPWVFKVWSTSVGSTQHADLPKKGRTIKDGEAIWDRDPPKHKIDWLGVDFLLEEFLKKKARWDEIEKYPPQKDWKSNPYLKL